MKGIAILVVLGIVAWSALHWDQVSRSMDRAFIYASDNPAMFWTTGGVLALILAITLLRTK